MQEGPGCAGADEPPSPAEDVKGGQLPLLMLALVVFTLASWLQERVSRSPEFNGPLLVLGETGAYVLGGLLWAGSESGLEGIRSCVSPSRYLVFMPASLAFFAMNLCQYPSLRVFGIVNHSLLVQLNLVVMAVMLWGWKGRQISLVQWASLAHLALGLLLLVSLSSGSSLIFEVTLQERSLAVVAVASCIGASAFASLYLEDVLRSNAQDAIFVQMHQMNMVQAVSALLLFHGVSGHSSAIGFLTPLFLTLAVSRGLLIGLVLKRAGSLANGAVGVASIIGVALVQLVIEGRQVEGLALQATILLSVFNYLAVDARGKGRADDSARTPGGLLPNNSWWGFVSPSFMSPMCLQVCLLLSLLMFLPHSGSNPIDVLQGTGHQAPGPF